jgi:5-methylcytosine-specific restriction endonuclease McrA
MEVLVLDSTWQPIGVVGWERAVQLVLDARARLVEQYADRMLRSAEASFPWPAVVALDRHVVRRRPARFDRRHVFARDGWACAYCGARPTRDGRPDRAALTLDHVVPRSRAQAGQVLYHGRRVPVTSWENVVTCCRDCNHKKAARTPEEARMPLLVTPRTPSPYESLRLQLARFRCPEEWRAYLPDAWARAS